MKIYLAASWSRKEEVRKIGAELNMIPGVWVKARWLTEPVPADYNDKFRRERAQMDVEDVLDADVLVRFTDDLRSATVPASLATGARMFEMGLAYAHKKDIIVVGGHQPIFDYLPAVQHVEDIEELKVALRILEHVREGSNVIRL